MSASTAGEPGTPAPHRVHVAHVSRRRLRLRLETRPVGQETSQALADRLAAVPGVAHVVVRPNTGSLIVDTLAEAPEVLDALKADPELKLVAAPRPPPVGQVLQMGLLKAEAGLGHRTDGALDLRTAIALVLIVGAVIQLTRGRIAGPATTLLMSAFALIDRNPPPARGPRAGP